MSSHARATALPQHAAPAASSPSVSPALTRTRTPVLQRACACGAVPGAGGKCAACEDKDKKTLQRASTGTAPASVPSIVNRSLDSPGRPLDAPTRAFMEPRFGHDFSGVRIHADSIAAESARAVSARAYAVGQDIAFAAGQYQPSTPEGVALIAHELAHTVQQGGLRREHTNTDLTIASESDASEREASVAASQVLSGQMPSVFPGSSPQLALHRAPLGTCPAGPVLDARRDRIYEVAELYVTEQFKKKRGAKNVFTNKELKDSTVGLDVSENRDAKVEMLAAIGRYFRSGRISKKPRVGRTTSVDPTAIDEQREAKEAPAAPAGRELEPDLVDLQTGELYDVTTEREARAKVGKVADYVKLLEEIRAGTGILEFPTWNAGRTFTDISPLTIPLRRGDPQQICFGVTDYDDGAYPGVLAYRPVNTAPGAAEAAEGAETGEAKVERVDYPVSAGTKKATLRVPVTFAKAKGDVVPIEGDPENSAAAALIPGLVLAELKHKFKNKISPDIVSARVDASGLPLAIDAKAKSVTLNVSNEGALTLDAASKKIKGLPFDYKFLSLGEITSLAINDTGGVDWTGYIKPSIPLLGRLDVSYQAGELTVTKGLKPGELKSPFPGVSIKEATIGLKLAPQFVPEGKLLLQFGADEKPLAEAALKATTDGIGIVMAGQLKVFIPGVDKAEADVVYKGGGSYGAGSWSGQITIESSQIKLPYVESGSVIVQLAPGGMIVDGKINLALPGENKATVGLHREPNAWILTGGGRFHVPKIGAVDVVVRYNTATQMLVASTKNVNFQIFGIGAKLDTLTAEIAPSKDPVFYGTGGVEITKGKATGHVSLTLNRNGKFTGKGFVKYRFNDKLVADAGVELDDKQRLKFSGQLTTSLHLFDKFGDDINLFSLDINVPIPGASIGGVGLKVTIGGGVTVGYWVGPGDVAPLILSADFYPLEENTDLSLAVSGMVSIPALVYLKANIFGGIVLDAFIAEVGGKIVLTGTITLAGGLFAPFSATYSQGKITASLTPEIKAALLLGLALDLTAWAKAGIGWLSVKTEKTWNLAQREINTGIGFSLKAPLSYSTDTGPKLPGSKEIDMKKPDITTAKMKDILRQLVEGSDPKERDV